MAQDDGTFTSTPSGGNTCFLPILVSEGARSSKQAFGGNVNDAPFASRSALGINEANLNVVFGVKGDIASISEASAGINSQRCNAVNSRYKDIPAFRGA